jgi:hypothetical protein
LFANPFDVLYWLFAICYLQLNGAVAQLVEQWTENPRVGGSIPSCAMFSLPMAEKT